MRRSAQNQSKGRDHLAIANRLGALALKISDGILDSFSKLADPGSTDAAGLIVIHTYFPPITVGRLAGILQLSHSGTVRLVDRLEQRHLLERSQGKDARSVTLKLTPPGLEQVQHILCLRQKQLLRLLGHLEDREVEELGRLISKLLASEAVTVEQAYRTCRYCDGAICTASGCPVEQSARHGQQRDMGLP
jgi:DNA-binding MarR family transcriptional regulator